MPTVNDELVTAADLQQFYCKGCDKWFKDFILFKCADCLRKGWYEIILDPEWFPKKLEDGSPDWNSVAKDNPKYYPNNWSYGRLNIETMEMERVTIHTGGKKWDYLDYQISTAIEDKKIEVEALRKIGKKTPEEIRQEIKIEKDIEKKEKAANEQENTQQTKPTDRQEKKEQKEVFKLIDKK